MKRTFLVPALVLTLPWLGGCATTKDVELESPNQWMADAQNDLLNKHANVVTTSGTALEGTILSLNDDSLKLRSEATGMVHTEPLSHIATIRPSRNAFPAIAGFLGGALIGGVVGGSIGVSSEPPKPDELGFNTVASGVTGMLVGGLIGAVGGSVALGLATSVTDYRLLPRR